LSASERSRWAGGRVSGGQSVCVGRHLPTPLETAQCPPKDVQKIDEELVRAVLLEKPAGRRNPLFIGNHPGILADARVDRVDDDPLDSSHAELDRVLTRLGEARIGPWERSTPIGLVTSVSITTQVWPPAKRFPFGHRVLLCRFVMSSEAV